MCGTGYKENSINPNFSVVERQKKICDEKGFSASGKITKKLKQSYHLEKWINCSYECRKLSLFLRKYVLNPQQMALLGYPIESLLHPGHAFIYKSAHGQSSEHFSLINCINTLDVKCGGYVVSADARPKRSCRGADKRFKDRGNEVEDEESSSSAALLTGRERTEKEAKRCVRCGRSFLPMSDKVCSTQEKCFYHWGKLHTVHGVDNWVSIKSEFTCCKRGKISKGCTMAESHVWCGVDVGVNGPLHGYVKTKPGKSSSPRNGACDVYSLDCEMCYTSQGLELTKITLVGTDGHIVYESFVKPENAIIDYNTRFSGITANDFKTGNSVKSLGQVQNDLAAFLNAETILIGHGLENDLKALKMIHSSVIDTSVIFPHYYGLPYRRSLRSLVKNFLNRDIQSSRHDSFEDAKACMELVLWKVRNDLKHKFTNSKSFLKMF